MSDATKLGKPGWARLFGSSALLNEVGRAGPRRLVIMSAVGISVAGLVVAMTLSGQHKQVVSSDARMKQIDALPGGLYSTPEQDALADRANTEAAAAAQRRGRSYTPPLAASAPLRAAAPIAELPVAAGAAAPPLQPRFIGKPARIYPAATPIAQSLIVEATPAVATSPAPQAIPVAQQVNDAQQAEYDQQVKTLFHQWDGRPPKTDIVLEPGEAGQHVSGEDNNGDLPAATRSQRNSQPGPRGEQTDPGQVLIPAGRGIYAHPVLALSSDQASPAVFQADSGPIAGDRMIGGFSRENNRLIVRISTIIHQGQQIGASGLVIAPETMEASVASGVDQHYLARFVLPAAAAFIEGLGQAIATTSNTTAVLGPLGGATTSTNLNLNQQLGVAAGAAAANIGSTLNAAAPKGPTITLDANVSVGVMFLSNVTYKPQG